MGIVIIIVLIVLIVLVFSLAITASKSDRAFKKYAATRQLNSEENTDRRMIE